MKITQGEVVNAVQKLKTGKACGLDGILAEMLKVGNHEILSFLCALCNTIFDKGYYPHEWAKAIIIHMHKTGNLDAVDNYRGV